MHSFTAESSISYTNSDGAYPDGTLVLSGNTLYGTAYGGGSAGNGTVFAVNTNGTGFTNLHSLAGWLLTVYQQRRSLSGGRIDFIGQHPIWDGD